MERYTEVTKKILLRQVVIEKMVMKFFHLTFLS